MLTLSGSAAFPIMITQWVVVRVSGARRRLRVTAATTWISWSRTPRFVRTLGSPVLDAILVGLNAERSSVDYGSGQQDLPITNYGEHVGSTLAKHS